MEGIRRGIGRLAVDLADDLFVAGTTGTLRKGRRTADGHGRVRAPRARRRCGRHRRSAGSARGTTGSSGCRSRRPGRRRAGRPRRRRCGGPRKAWPVSSTQAIGIEPGELLGVRVVERQHARPSPGCEACADRAADLLPGVCYAASRSPVTASSRLASASEIRVNGRRHSGEAISPCRHSRYLIGIGLASANSSGTRGASGAQAARAPATSLSAKRRPTSTKRFGHEMARRQDAALGAVGHHGEEERVLAGQHGEACRACAPAARAIGRCCPSCPSRPRCWSPRRARAASRSRGSPPCDRGCCRSARRGRSPRRWRGSARSGPSWLGRL